MRVKNLESWSGHDFSYVPGEIIEIDDDIALARIAGGVCAAIDEEPAPTKRKVKKEEPVE